MKELSLSNDYKMSKMRNPKSEISEKFVILSKSKNILSYEKRQEIEIEQLSKNREVDDQIEIEQQNRKEIFS